MVDILQTLGVGYLVFMIYLTFLYYKKNNFTLKNFVFWIVVWCGGIILMIMPETTSLITQKLSVPSVIDFYLILGLIFFSIICFFCFLQVKKNEQKIEDLVRKLAMERRKK